MKLCIKQHEIVDAPLFIPRRGKELLLFLSKANLYSQSQWIIEYTPLIRFERHPGQFLMFVYIGSGKHQVVSMSKRRPWLKALKVYESYEDIDE